MGPRPLAGICILALSTGVSEPACPSHARETAPAALAAAPTPTKPDPFNASVRPVLAARCAPCHEPGGKLYEKLPFDNPKVIADHRTGVLRRFQGDDRANDRAILEAWLKTQPAD